GPNPWLNSLTCGGINKRPPGQMSSARQLVPPGSHKKDRQPGNVCPCASSLIHRQHLRYVSIGFRLAPIDVSERLAGSILHFVALLNSPRCWEARGFIYPLLCTLTLAARLLPALQLSMAPSQQEGLFTSVIFSQSGSSASNLYPAARMQ